MGIFAWFRGGKKTLQPEAQWKVWLSEDAISSEDQTGVSQTVSKDQLYSIAIETNDSGPWGADVWWLMFDIEGRLSCAFPQGATGEEDAVKYLMGLAGFDHSSMISAMGSTSNKVFPVWQRQQH
jgi:hypothetical protein